MIQDSCCNWGLPSIRGCKWGHNRWENSFKNYDLLGTGYICLDFLDWFLFTVVRSYFFLHLRNFSLNTKNAQIPARKDSSSWWPSPQPPPPSLPGRTVSGFKKFQPDLILPGHCTGWRAIQVRSIIIFFAIWSHLITMEMYFLQTCAAFEQALGF